MIIYPNKCNENWYWLFRFAGIIVSEENMGTDIVYFVRVILKLQVTILN